MTNLDSIVVLYSVIAFIVFMLSTIQSICDILEEKRVYGYSTKSSTIGDDFICNFWFSALWVPILIAVVILMICYMIAVLIDKIKEI